MTDQWIKHGYKREDFVKWLKNADTIVDTLFIFGPNNREKLAEMAEQLDEDPTQIDRIRSEIEDMVEPEVISKYPDFNREEIDTDESQQAFALNSAFPDGRYSCIKQVERPKPSN